MSNKYYNFYYGLFVDRKLPPFFDSISFKNGSKKTYCANPGSESELQYGAARNCPDYLEYKFKTYHGLTCDRFYSTGGYAINLVGVDSAEGYLAQHFKPNFRTSLRRRLKGLETCFNIRYEMYFGEIQADTYDFLMRSLENMLTRRFNQRNDTNMALQDWSYYRDRSMELILKKEASLFAIYDGENPIQITLNYHFGEILFQAIPSYDIDYEKFGLGNISIYKIVEWCTSEKYSMLDMGFGAFDYKLKWCNFLYRFNHYIFYDQSSLLSQIFRYQNKFKTHLINFLLRHRVNVFYHYCRDLLFGGKKSDLRKFVSEPFPGSIPQNPEPIRVYPFQDESYFFLKKAINDFVYSQNEARTKIEVYELKKGFEYLLSGTKAQLRVLYS